ncbi:GMC oxidoreductase [Streptomyces sp. NBC_00322]|uniref:GMC oxidoreductase n=1 Tax=Streptomyces sp. NBC_00322 TaxID=2975712 RepID=UPI003FA7ACA0
MGAGAAGCVVRADPAHRMLRLEAGPPDRSPLIHPVDFTKLTSPKVNWRFETLPQRHLDNRRMYIPVVQRLLFRTGPVTACVAEAGAFFRSGADVRSPDIQIHCLPAYVVNHGRQRIKGRGGTINPCNLRPRSIGQVTLRSADPLDAPAVDPNFPADPWAANCSPRRASRRSSSASTCPVRGCGRKRRSVHTSRWAKTDYHPIDTCEMGQDDTAVVDTDLRVHGLAGACDRRFHHAEADQREHPGAIDHDR